MTTGRTALVLGATGSIGGEMARRLKVAGWQVRALHRNPDRVASLAGGASGSWIAGDAMRATDVVAAAEGADLIVHAVNPPGYRNWAQLVLPMLDSTIAAARENGARIVLPGTVYNYGPDVFPLIAEDAPQRPMTRKGALRVEMERRLRAASEDGVRTLVVRAGDFFGPSAVNSWFSQAVVKPGRVVAAVTNPGAPGVGHQWAYLPDVAETMMRLVAREADLPAFATFHMEGHWDPDGNAMGDAIRRVLRRPGLPIRRFPWWLIRLAAPFVPLCRELAEMRYLWRTPVRLDNRRLAAFLGVEPRTCLDDAVRATLQGMGCIGARETVVGSAAFVQTISGKQ
ncbi:MAG: NAD-dependent epimerase/dehydratase family protein [Pseudomonadota bacterium]